jgi:hypothetical protein
VPEFPRFANLSPAEWSRITSDPAFEAQKDVVKLSTFAFMLLHEFAHHLEPKLDYRIREDRADKVAAELSARAGFNPMLAFWFFPIFARLEEDQGVEPGKSGYSSALCRQLYMFDQGRLAAERDPDFVASIKKQGLWNEWVAAPGKLREFLREEGVSCPGLELKQTQPPTGSPSGVPDREGGQAKAEQPTHKMRVRAWRPTPGQCNGVQLEIYVDGELAAEIDNMLDVSPEDIGVLTEGTHEFEFRSISGFCVDPYPPYQTREFISDGSCSGTFSVRRAGELKLAVQAAYGRIVHCSMR